MDFGEERWEKIKETYGLWWEGKLDRPLILAVTEGRDPGRAAPKAPVLSQATCNDLTIPAEDIIDRLDYELSKCLFYGDDFPFVNMDCFGPGVLTAFLGAKLDNSSGRVWFYPPEDKPINEIHLEYRENNIWLNRVKDICVAAMKRWKGKVMAGMPDLGGNLDILAVFRTTEGLLMDLYDYPEEVKRLLWEAHDLWHRIYNEINEVLQPVNPGYTDWSCVYSDKPYYILQSDFSYMISPSMFEEFALPELATSISKLDRCFYHLDGKGQLANLDTLLKNNKLDGIQWVPGDGNPGLDCWPEVYRKIHAAGKKIYSYGYPGILDAIIEQIGTGKGIYHRLFVPQDYNEDDIERYIEKFL